MTRNKREQMLTKTVSRTALCLAVSMAFVGVAMADPGGLRIQIMGNGGAPLAGATVKISSPDSLVAKTAVTDAEGRVRLSGLDPATNYTVEVVASGYDNFSAGNVAVVGGKDLSVGYSIGGAKDEVVLITGRSLAAVDTTSATVGTTLTLDTLESLPTGRSYQSYLQLVPGVTPSASGNPASRSGINYSDVGGVTGTSSDNTYIVDGIDVTDPATGTFGSNFNSEIIQEQQVITGAVPAEYAGGSGLISTVTTKSGSNEFHGSINYYLQNDDLVAKDKHATSGGYSTYDTAVTLGGPIIKDHLWFFGSYQKKNRKDEVLNPTTGAVRRNVERTDEFGFGKLTWQVTDNNRLTASYFDDPAEISGSRVATTLNNRDSKGIQGGDNYKLEYDGTFGDLLINAYGFRHRSEVSSIAADQSIRDTVIFRAAQASTIEQRNLGGAGTSSETHRDQDQYGISAQYFLETGFGSHTIKGGYISAKHVYSSNSTVPGGATYQSLNTQYAGTNFATAVSGTPGWTARPIVAADAPRIITAASANAAAKAALDTNADGTISTAELNALTFNSTTTNPYGNVSLYRAVRSVNAPYSVESKGQTIYLQDTWTLDQFTVNAGVRAEEWSHYDSGGTKLFTFDWEIAPRLSLVYDVFGDGRSKLFTFGGRYYDPIRNDISNFAGNLSGPVTDEQININGQFVTFRTRGGPVTPDSVFGSGTKTPYTDEFIIGGSTTFGSDIGLSMSITNRKTRDIFEDFDLAVYADPTLTAATAGVGNAYPGSFFYLPYSYFGFATKPNANYVLGTLPKGKRDYWGFEAVLTKYKTDHWFGQMSYTYNDAHGNSNSDGNADFAGDVIFLDPRAPNVYGRQPGSIKHLFKAYGSYDFDIGLKVSGVFNWNSGAAYTPAQNVSGRYFAPQAAVPYSFGGVTENYFLPGYVGSQTTPSYFTFDMRFAYELNLPFGKTELFLDAFNILNKQSPTSVQKLLAGDGIYAYQQDNAWVAPRSLYVGARFSF